MLLRFSLKILSLKAEGFVLT